MPRGRNDYETAQIQQRLWTPAVLRPAMWLDMADLSTMDFDASGCNTLRDKSGNMSAFTQATGAAKPIFAIHAASGLPALSFDGADSMFSSSGITSGTYTGQITWFYFATRTNTGAGAGGDVFTERNAAGGSGGYILAWLEFSSFYYIADPVTVSVTVFNMLSSSGAIISQNHTSGATDKLWVNGSSQTVTGTTGNITAAAGSYLGSRSGGGNPWNGLIGEIVALTANLNTRDRQVAEGYLSWKWGITLAADHPFANRPPLIGD